MARAHNVYCTTKPCLKIQKVTAYLIFVTIMTFGSPWVMWVLVTMVTPMMMVHYPIFYVLDFWFGLVFKASFLRYTAEKRLKVLWPSQVLWPFSFAQRSTQKRSLKNNLRFCRLKDATEKKVNLGFVCRHALCIWYTLSGFFKWAWMFRM